MNETKLKLALELDEIAKLNIKYFISQFGQHIENTGDDRNLLVIKFDTSQGFHAVNVGQWLDRNGYVKKGEDNWLPLTKKGLDLILGTSLRDNFVGVDEL